LYFGNFGELLANLQECFAHLVAHLIEFAAVFIRQPKSRVALQKVLRPPSALQFLVLEQSSNCRIDIDIGNGLQFHLERLPRQPAIEFP
jgi:hypothetical protein